jgi:hypothetical protein
MQPHPSHYTHGMFVVERPPGRLGKRGGRVWQLSAVGRWCGFGHLRFATPARGPLHDSYGGVIGRPLGLSRDRARLTPPDTGQWRTMSAPLPPSSRAALPSPSEQCARIALVASGRRLERMGGRRHTREAERRSSDE